MYNKKKGMSKNKVLLLVGIGALFFILIFCISLMQTIDERMDQNARDSLTNTTKTISSTIQYEFNNDLKTLNAVANIIYFNEQDDLKKQELQRLKETTRFSKIYYVDVNGNGFDDEGIPFSIDSVEFEEVALSKGESGNSKAYVGDSGRMQISFQVPIFDENQQIAGALYADCVLNNYYSSSLFTFYNNEGRTYLFDTDSGEYYLKSAGSDGLDEFVSNFYQAIKDSGNNDKNVDSLLTAVKDNKTGSMQIKFNGENSYVCFTPLESMDGWSLATIISKDDLLKESDAVKTLIMMVIGCLVVAVVIGAGGVVYLISTMTKAKERKSREKILDNISGNTDYVLVIYDPIERLVEFVSDNIYRLIDISKRDVQDSFANLFKQLNIDDNDEWVQDLYLGKLNTRVAREFKIGTMLNKRSRWLNFQVVPGDDDKYIVVIEDTTFNHEYEDTLKMATATAEQANRAKSDFFSAMSHDMRTPMNGIIGMTGIAKTHINDQNKVQQCLEKIDLSSKHLLNLINEVLDMSKIENGKLSINEVEFRLSDFIYDVTSLIKPNIDNKKQVLEVQIEKINHDKVIGDCFRLQQAIINVLSNAVKYTPIGGHIVFRVTEMETRNLELGSFKIEIQDNGLGMDEEFLKRVFEPFERANDSRIDKIQGTGLGMAITKNIVELMEGTISVKSEIGKGSTFTITVNFKLADTKECINKLNGLDVLIIDSGNIVENKVSDLLVRSKINYREITFEQIGKEEVSKDCFAIFLDFRKYDGDKRDVVAKVRDYYGHLVSLIIITENPLMADEQEALQAGVSIFISEPLFESTLIFYLKIFLDGQEREITNDNEYLFDGVRVLLVEDNELNQEIAMEILSSYGAKVTVANNGQVASDTFMDSPINSFDIILMDVQMPVMNGYEATKKIRLSNRLDASIPIVAMTAGAYVEDINNAYAAGMDAHISKPIDLEILKKTMKKYLYEER